MGQGTVKKQTKTGLKNRCPEQKANSFHNKAGYIKSHPSIYANIWV